MVIPKGVAIFILTLIGESKGYPFGKIAFGLVPSGPISSDSPNAILLTKKYPQVIEGTPFTTS